MAQGNQSIKEEDAIGFLRENALITEIGGTRALTSRGERFLNQFTESLNGQSSSSALRHASFDVSNRSEGTSQL